MTKSIFACAAAALLSSVISINSVAAPWISPDEIHLRADIQMLADVGVITVPVNTFPLMWSGIIRDIDQASISEQPESVRMAVHRVRHAFTQQNDKQGVTSLSIGAATNDARFQHFGTPLREKGEASISHEGMGNRIAYKLKATYAYDAQDDEDLRLDGSYLSMIIGNWAITGGVIDQWWGPGWDTALTMSSNARPIPTMMISRNYAEPFDFPVLEWLGPWTLSTGVGILNDDDRYVEDALLWTFRATIKPIPQLELGMSRSAQICGDDRSCSLSTWGDMLGGDDNTGTEDEPGNQLAALDFRWGDTAWGVPYGIYGETMGEDNFEISKFPPFSAKSYLYGADISFQIADNQIRTFFEYTDTGPWCNGQHNCAYEHHLYQSGYRYWDRSIGSTYDNDTKSYTLGFVGIRSNGHQWKSNFRYLDLNFDNENKAPPGGNTVAPIAEQAKQVDVSYLMPMFHGRIEVGMDYTYSDYDNADEDSDGVWNGWVNWEYVF
ncbi:capsule assembly Wzi family protein [Corallincola luteus]|uniref:Capsule assembly Wzi family protein n=1 Tax=Corallincola luteus TaxID=1775177 RepID=A0ABY2AT36_9GAMM|nr:capsule assembly Wzi family protein [Corallincola luteus]TCI05442.1 capsule assembly Wzi family protein [Corallincola luteus]